MAPHVPQQLVGTPVFKSNHSLLSSIEISAHARSNLSSQAVSHSSIQSYSTSKGSWFIQNGLRLPTGRQADTKPAESCPCHKLRLSAEIVLRRNFDSVSIRKKSKTKSKRFCTLPQFLGLVAELHIDVLGQQTSGAAGMGQSNLCYLAGINLGLLWRIQYWGFGLLGDAIPEMDTGITQPLVAEP